jgi:hypothetical protein
MPAYLITYDLDRASSDHYEDLYRAIKSYGVWARVTESTWVVVTEQPAKEVRDTLGEYLRKGDRLFVLKSGVEAAWRNVRCDSDWLKKWL